MPLPTDILETWTDAPAATPPPGPERAPTERYVTRRELGRGGMGRVLVAWDTLLQREVAIKVLLAGRGRRAFLREARIAGHLEHPAIVPVHDAGVTEQGEAFYVMRLVRGRTLGELLSAATTLPERLGLLDALVDVARALAHAHQQGVVHRDLKPDNVMVGPWGEVQVVDWGLARVLAEADPAIRALAEGDGAEHVLGTPAWMSPEQAGGVPADARSDVWALGLLLRALLTGHGPWPQHTDPAELMASVREGRLPPLPPELPAELAAIVRRACAASPADRYPDAAGFVEELLAFRAGNRVRAHVYSAREELVRVARRFRWPLRLVGAVAVVAAIGVGSVARESAQARRAERATEQANEALAARNAELGDALRSAQLRAARSADRERLGFEALAWAATVLESAPEDPVARGIVGRWLHALPVRVERVWGRVPGPCDQMLAGPAPDTFVCGGPDGVWRWENGVRWHRPGSARLLAVDGATAVAAANDHTVVGLALDTGAEVWRHRFPGRPSAALLDGADVLVAVREVVERRSLADDVLRHSGSSTSAVAMLRATADGVEAWTASGTVLTFDDALQPLQSRVTVPRVAIARAAVGGENVFVLLPDQGLMQVGADLAPRPIALEGRPFGLGASADGARAYVTVGGTFVLVDPERGLVQRALPTAGGTAMLLTDDRRAWVAPDGVLLTVREATRDFGRRPPAGVARLVRSGEDRLLASFGRGEVWEIDVADWTLERVVQIPDVFPGPDVVALAPDEWFIAVSGRLYHQVGAVQTVVDDRPVRSLLAWRDGWARLYDDGVRFVASGVDRTVPVPAGARRLGPWEGDAVLALGASTGWRVAPDAGAVPLSPPEPGAPLDASGLCGRWWQVADGLWREPVAGEEALRVPFSHEGRSLSVCGLPDARVAVAVDDRVLVLSADGVVVAEVGPLPARVAQLGVVGDWLVVGTWGGDLERWWLPTLERSGPELVRLIRDEAGFVVRGGRVVPAGPP